MRTLSKFQIALFIFLSVAVTTQAGAVTPREPKNSNPSRTYRITLTQEQAAKMLRERASDIPQAILNRGIEKIGQLNLRDLLEQIQNLPAGAEVWTATPNQAGSNRYFTRFIHGPTLSTSRAIFNGELWYIIPPESQSELALNAVLEALGYNDAFYQMTTFLWFFSQPDFASSLTKGESILTMRYATQFFVKLPDRSLNPENPNDPYGSQLPVHYGKIRMSSQDAIPNLANLHADDFTVFVPADPTKTVPGQSISIVTEPFIPSRALTSGGGDFGGVSLKRSMLDSGLKQDRTRRAQTGQDERVVAPMSVQGKLFENLRLAMTMGYEFNWKLEGN